MKYSLPPNGDRNPMGWTHAHSSSSEAATGYSQLAISNGQISEHKQEERYSLARIIQDAYSEEDEGSKAERWSIKRESKVQEAASSRPLADKVWPRANHIPNYSARPSVGTSKLQPLSRKNSTRAGWRCKPHNKRDIEDDDENTGFGDASVCFYYLSKSLNFTWLFLTHGCAETTSASPNMSTVTNQMAVNPGRPWIEDIW